MSYDFSEPMIRALVERNHVPEEIITRTNADGLAVGEIVCEACGEEWPCSTLKALRASFHIRNEHGSFKITEPESKK